MKTRPSHADIVKDKTPDPAAVDALADEWERLLRDQITAKVDKVTIPTGDTATALVEAAASQFEAGWHVNIDSPKKEVRFVAKPATQVADTAPKPARSEEDDEAVINLYLLVGSVQEASDVVYRFKLPGNGTLTWVHSNHHSFYSKRTLKLKTAAGLPYRGCPYVIAAIKKRDLHHFVERYMKNQSKPAADIIAAGEITVAAGEAREYFADRCQFTCGVFVEGCIGEGDW